MRVPYTAAALLAAALALPAGASADATVRAVDGSNTWSPAAVTIKVGETVTWNFAALPHNVKNASSNWEFQTNYLFAPSTASKTFTAAGEYRYLCQLHGSTMTGTITVLDEAGTPQPPPPAPPLGEQPFANDIAPLTVFEKRDRVAPKLTRVKATGIRRGVRVALRLSEAGKVTVRATRGKAVVKRTIEVAKGRRTVTVRGLKAGRYRVQVTASDLAGNAAKAKPRTRVTVRG
jgi:plastocyanin